MRRGKTGECSLMDIKITQDRRMILLDATEQ